MASDKSAAQKSELSGTVTQDTILKIAKEITVKFIEVGRITPATFDLTFNEIYSAIDKTVTKG